MNLMQNASDGADSKIVGIRVDAVSALRLGVGTLSCGSGPRGPIHTLPQSKAPDTDPNRLRQTGQHSVFAEIRVAEGFDVMSKPVGQCDEKSIMRHMLVLH